MATEADLFKVGDPVLYVHAWQSAPRPMQVIELRFNRIGGRLWWANSYYVLKAPDCGPVVVDLVDAHSTGGGMVQRH